MKLFITFEGGEGCGKSLQSKYLYHSLIKSGYSSILIREPGGTPLGEKIRSVLMKSSRVQVSPLSELLLFNASRSQLMTEVVKPALDENMTVVCDRFSDSTLAYQSYGRGLDIKIVDKINRIASQGLIPDLTILLDAPPEVGLTRKLSGTSDRFQQEDLEFHRRVREGFLELAAANPSRWLVIDSTLSKNIIREIIWTRVIGLIKTT